MAEQQISLFPFYKGWDTYQELLIKAIEPLSLDQLSLRTAPQLRSIGDLATHIIGVRAGWLYYTLEKGDENLVSLASQPARSALPLCAGGAPLADRRETGSAGTVRAPSRSASVSSRCP